MQNKNAELYEFISDVLSAGVIHNKQHLYLWWIYIFVYTFILARIMRNICRINVINVTTLAVSEKYLFILILLCKYNGINFKLNRGPLTIKGSFHIEETVAGWRSQLRMKTSVA